MTVPTHFDAVIQGLSQDQSLTRIKKLLLYLCRNQWESHPARLDAVTLEVLVQELLQVASNLDQLKIKLNKIVRSLNKPAEYALVANAIVNHLQPLYSDELDSTQVVVTNNRYAETKRRLEQNPQHLRIQKILFCACNGRWENDSNFLNRYPLDGLIERLHTLTPTLEELQAVLFSIVKTLNRQAEYTLVAHIIVEAFTPLYSPPSGSTQILFPDTDSSSSAALTSDGAHRVGMSPPTQQVMVHSALDEPVVELPKEPPDWFDLRIEVMKYTSPLRAKALLFSALYQSVDATGEGWFVVRSHDLDELLQAVVDRYPTYGLLETALKDAAKALTEAKQYLQAAGAVLRAVRPWYSYTESVAGGETPAPLQGSHPPQAPPSTAPIRPVPSSSGNDDTCSFLPPPVPAQPMTVKDGNKSGPLTPPLTKASEAEDDRTLDLTPVSQPSDVPQAHTDAPEALPSSSDRPNPSLFNASGDHSPADEKTMG